MALKKKKNKAEESKNDNEGKLINQITGQPFPEAPRKRQGDGVATGEVPTGFNK